MSTRAKWASVALILLGITFGAQYVWGVVLHHEPKIVTTATTISPEELTKHAGPLSDTVIGSFF